MRFVAVAGAALLMIGLPSWCQAQVKVCDNPRQMEGFKTCANIEKAEAEGAFTLYSTDPEQGQVKLLAAFNKIFPKIKTSYVRLQAGALYAKVLSERQAKSYLVDVIQISDMGMIRDFQKRGGFRQYISPEMAAFKPEYKSQPEGFWTWGSIIMAGIAYNPNNVSAAEAPKTWEDLLDPKWTDAINVKVSNSGLQHGVWYMLKPILGDGLLQEIRRHQAARLRFLRPAVRPAGRRPGQDHHGRAVLGLHRVQGQGRAARLRLPGDRRSRRVGDLRYRRRRSPSQRRRAVHGLVPLADRPAGAERRPAAAFAAPRRAGAGGQRARSRT